MAKIKEPQQIKQNHTHWIIYSSKRNSIWKGPFYNYEEARKEYQRMMTSIAPELWNEDDWKIEVHY